MPYDPPSLTSEVALAMPASSGSSQSETFGGGAAPSRGCCSASGPWLSLLVLGLRRPAAFGGAGGGVGSAEGAFVVAEGCGLAEGAGSGSARRGSGALGTLACIATSAVGLRFEGMAATYAAVAPSTAAMLNGTSLRF